jgi:hypothetical protein
MLIFYHTLAINAPSTFGRTSQQLLQRSQVPATHLRLLGCPHRDASCTVKHPLRYLQQVGATLDRPDGINDRDATACH